MKKRIEKLQVSLGRKSEQEESSNTISAAAITARTNGAKLHKALIEELNKEADNAMAKQKRCG